jgi:hypothetical protein
LGLFWIIEKGRDLDVKVPPKELFYLYLHYCLFLVWQLFREQAAENFQDQEFEYLKQ